MNDEVAQQVRAVLGTRHFVDRESGVLLVWLPAGGELSGVVGALAQRHPGTSITLQEAGSAVAVRMSARDQDLAEIEALYLTDTT